MSYCRVQIVIHAAYVECANELIFYFLPGRRVKEVLQTHG